ncbi:MULTISPECIES: DUF1540 domain-containing protein [unclassified Romboutsia]|uniref:DUF1540 domain-containing protein n=1 Tax=unclassified Romboutsia TaxID=2626894 RepID=UPI000820507A|nr:MULTISPECIES: DUF1540 domain-containing protein [unclassified Romboutsia]SCH05279.1 Domain of Uncharacterised Function (DUF1540) [uncultured Clostridium sp.]
MSNLNCSATNCGYNNSGNCYAGKINVDGKSATTTSNTYCSTFVSGHNSSFTNSTNCNCTKPDDIKCDAVNCTYNDNKYCKAESVKINAHDASCETFMPR